MLCWTPAMAPGAPLLGKPSAATKHCHHHCHCHSGHVEHPVPPVTSTQGTQGTHHPLDMSPRVPVAPSMCHHCHPGHAGHSASTVTSIQDTQHPLSLPPRAPSTHCHQHLGHSTVPVISTAYKKLIFQKQGRMFWTQALSSHKVQTAITSEGKLSGTREEQNNLQRSCGNE